MQSCLVTNENEKENSCEVEILSSTSPLMSTTAINHNNSSEIVFKSSVIAASLPVRELESCMLLSRSDFNTAIATLKSYILLNLIN